MAKRKTLDGYVVTAGGERVAYADIIKMCEGRHFRMKLVGAAAQFVTKAVNQGIDAYLEACFVPDRRDSYVPTIDSVAGTPVVRRLACRVSPESLPVLLRRLYAADRRFEAADDDADRPASLADGILDALRKRSDR